MGIGSSLYSALTTAKKKQNEYNANKNYASQIDRTNKWSDELESLYGQISNHEKFSYDMNNDAFYKQYAQQYQNNAKLAMQDTVAQASALTGGYGNSYAATAGQAMYNQQMQGLNDRATELYQLALQQYNAEADRLNNLYSMTANAYGMEQDRINADIAEAQWNAEFDEAQRQYNWNMIYNASRAMAQDAQWAAGYAFDVGRAAVSDAQWEKSFDYNASRDKVADEQWQKTFDYNASRDAVADSQWKAEFNYQKQRDDISDAQFKSELDYKYAALNGKIEEESLYDYEIVRAAMDANGFTDFNSLTEEQKEEAKKKGYKNLNLLTEEEFRNYKYAGGKYVNGKELTTYEDYLKYVASRLEY